MVMRWEQVLHRNWVAHGWAELALEGIMHWVEAWHWEEVMYGGKLGEALECVMF